MAAFSRAPHSTSLPRVLCLSGHDPGGGAGLQADIETVAALGGHALGVITALTVQDTRNVQAVTAVEPALFAAQIRCLLIDCPPQALKIGLLGSAEQLPHIVEAIDRAHVPAVCDPVLRAGGGTDLGSTGIVEAMRRQLLPRLTLLTPNAAEARRLTGRQSLADCARCLLDDGCANVLITGGDEPGEEVVNVWYTPSAPEIRFAWPRLPETFHGAGCTLSAAIACRLALGDELGVAIECAQRWTQDALRQAFAVGGGRRIPLRRAGVPG